MLKKYVDNMEQGKQIYSCQLLASYEGTEAKIPLLLHEFHLLGAKPPYNKFKILYPPTIKQPEGEFV